MTPERGGDDLALPRGLEVMRLRLVLLGVALSLVAASSTAHAGPVANTAVSYRLCQDPDRSYFVVGVYKTNCRRGRQVAKEYFRRLYGNPASRYRIYGYRCTKGRVGIYYGLTGTRAYCKKRRTRLRFDSRGE